MSDFEDEVAGHFASDPERPRESGDRPRTVTGVPLPRYHAPGDVICQWNPPNEFVEYSAGKIKVKVFGYWHNRRFYRLMEGHTFIDGVWFNFDDEGIRKPTRALDLGEMLHERTLSYNRAQVRVINRALEEVISGEHEYSPAKGPFIFMD